MARRYSPAEDVSLMGQQVEELIDEKDGAKKYQSFVNSYNYEREHGGINGMTPAEKFMKCLKPQILVH